MKAIRYGDLIGLALQGEFDMIVHGCNIYHIMGAGIAKEIKQVFPEAYMADLQTKYGDHNKLGSISVGWKLLPEFRVLGIINAYTQTKPGPTAKLEYIRSCFKEIKKCHNGSRFGVPKIGCGYGGLDWKDVEPIIDEELEGEEYTYVFYE